MTASSEENSTQGHWLVGAVIDGVDQVDRFVAEGIWENGYTDKFLDQVLSVKPGDCIAIKATYVRKNDVSFDNHGNKVSTMAIKAVGTVASNPGDGRRLLVDWDLLPERREWYFWTYRNTICQIVPGHWARDALIRFVFDGQPQDYKRFRNHPYWYERFGEFDSSTVQRFGWTRFYATVADNLLKYRDNREELVSWLHGVASRVDGLSYLTDKFPDGSSGFVQDICPFTAMGIFNRVISDSRRKNLAGEFASFLKVAEPVPDYFTGIPTFDNRLSWLFGYAADRGAGDIDALWDVFYEGIRLADAGDDFDSSAFCTAYDRAAALPGVGWRITKGLYWIRPWDFPTLDGFSREYITDELGVTIPTSGGKGRCTAAEYLHVKNALKEKFFSDECSVHSFPDLSDTAWERKLSSDVSSLVDARLDSFKSLVVKSFPGFSGVADSSFQAEEIEYKRKAVGEIGAMLSQSVFAEMMAAGEYSELIKLLRSAGSKTNLLYQGTPMKGDLAPLYNDYSDEAGLCSAFYNLIWGAGESFVRLFSFYEFVAGAGLPVKWPTATYYLFMVHPETEMFVKPRMIRWVLDFFKMPIRYQTKPTGELYQEITGLCSLLGKKLAAWGVTDMVDVHSLIWAAYKGSKEAGEEMSVSFPEEEYKLNPKSMFTDRTFELLEILHKEPTMKTYEQFTDEFSACLQDPMRKLFSVIASEMPLEFAEHLETEKRIFSRIPKNDWGKGGVWDFYWGAFYSKGMKRTAADQLYLTVDRSGIRFGFSQGRYIEDGDAWLKGVLASDSLLCKKLRESLSSIPGLMYSATPASEIGTPLSASSGFASFDEWVENIDTAELEVSAYMSSNEVLSISFDDLKERVASVFAALFPLVMHDTVKTIAAVDRVSDEDSPVPNPPLSLNEIHSSTGYNREWIGRAVAAFSMKKQAVLYGPPGTGKTYLAKMIASHLIGGGFGFCDVVQFHPSYSYEDFIEGLRPVASSSGVLEYKMIDGRFKEFCIKAREVAGPCVLVVDEINRANLSRVFGELMYLLEYRGDKIPLAGGSSFSIPSNVYIIGTMNTADRSIALVDHALRRRFAFIHMKPDYSVLGHYHTRKGTGFDPAGLESVLLRVNKAIEDRNYFVGVSFFLHEDIEKRIENVWQLEIEPYLEEYFFDRPDTAELFSRAVVCKEITGRE